MTWLWPWPANKISFIQFECQELPLMLTQPKLPRRPNYGQHSRIPWLLTSNSRPPRPLQSPWPVSYKTLEIEQTIQTLSYSLICVHLLAPPAAPPLWPLPACFAPAPPTIMTLDVINYEIANFYFSKSSINTWVVIWWPSSATVKSTRTKTIAWNILIVNGNHEEEFSVLNSTAHTK